MDFESKNLTVSRGKMLFAEYLAGTQNAGPYRDLGNCPEFTMTREEQTLDHYSSQVRGFRTKDESITISSELNGALTCDDCKVENWRMWFMSKVDTITTTLGSALTETFTEVKPGDIYQLGVTTGNPTGLRKITTVVVTDGAVSEPVTFVLGVDYALDEELGLITILSGGTLTAGDDIKVAYGNAASTRTQIKAGSAAVEGALKFVSFNPLGEDADIFLPRVKLQPSGDISMLSDPESPDFMSFGLNIQALQKGQMAVAYRDGRPV